MSQERPAKRVSAKSVRMIRIERRKAMNTKLLRHCRRAFPAFLLPALVLAGLATGPGARQDDEPSIVSHMKSINRNLRRLRRDLREPGEVSALLSIVASMKEKALAAKEESPLKTPDLPEPDRKPFLEAYRKAMDGLISDLGHLETAISKRDWDTARDLVSKLYDLKRESHQEFQKKEEGG